MGGQMYFTADDGIHGRSLFTTDGTGAGTQRIPGAGADPLSIGNLSAVGTELAFSADDGTNNFEFWMSDGTAAGTRMVKDIHPTSSSFPSNFVYNGSQLLFTANDGGSGTELWVSDGTEAGTQLLKDIYPGSTGSSARSLFATSTGQVLFTARNVSNGFELWTSDGTAAGTNLLKDIWPGSGNSFPNYFTELGSYVYFTANGGSGYQIWRTDGTAANTVPITGSYSSASELTVFEGKLLFTASGSGIGFELFIHDPATTTATNLADIWPGSSSSSPRNFCVAGSQLYFQSNDGTHGAEIWVTDGTGAGTTLALDVVPGADGSNPTDLKYVNGKLMFLSRNHYLYESDGTEAGTDLLDPIFPEANISPDQFNLIPLGTQVLIEGENLRYGREIWTYSPGGSLPVEGLRLSGSWEGNRVSLQWETLREQNSDFFELQRSVDGLSFGRIHRETAQGYSDQRVEYHHRDLTAPTGEEVLYYRLRQVDFDGSFTYSEVLALRQQAGSPSLGLYPNPGLNPELDLRSWTGACELWIFDLQGRRLEARQLQGGQVHRLKVALPYGWYVLQVKDGQGQRAALRWLRQ
jgi:ELWxxDGT repeat protein